MAEEWVAILVPIGGMAMVLGIIVVVATIRLRAARIHADTVGKLIDKLGTSQEAMAYLESESGQKLLDSVTSGRRNPCSRILGAIRSGAILCTFGVSGLFITDDDTLYAIDSESNVTRHPGWRTGVRIGPASEDRLTGLVPPHAHETRVLQGVAGEGVAVNADGNVYAAEGPGSRPTAGGGITKYVAAGN